MSSNLDLTPCEPFPPPTRDLREWDGLSASAEMFRVHFSEASCSELRQFTKTLNENCELEDIAPDLSTLQEFTADVERFREQLELGFGMVIIDPIPLLPIRSRQLVSWLVSRLLGTSLVQNSDGNRLVHVYDRDRTQRMEDGARYHQTRQSGSIHTDNVNAPEPWEYLVFSCIEPAFLGGESIIVNGYAVHSCLAEHAPDALRILEQDFVWEYRGIADDVYHAPIVTYGPDGDPYFRYLRTYLESAHRKIDQPLTNDQLWALDVLDSVLERSDLQLMHRLLAGEIMITFDPQIFHGRTSFADHPQAVSIDNLTNCDAPLQRTFERRWVRSDRLTQTISADEQPS